MELALAVLEGIDYTLCYALIKEVARTCVGFV
jgi:hypothetical protein